MITGKMIKKIMITMLVLGLSCAGTVMAEPLELEEDITSNGSEVQDIVQVDADLTANAVTEIIEYIRSNGELKDTTYSITKKDSDNNEYKIIVGQDNSQLTFASNIGDDSDWENWRMYYDCNTGKIESYWDAAQFLDLQICTIFMNGDIDNSKYRKGDIVHVTEIEKDLSINTYLYRGSIQYNANFSFLKSMEMWNELLTERTGYDMKDVGFTHFDEVSTDDMAAYFSGKTFVNGITIDTKKADLGVGDKKKITPTIYPDTADDKTVNWSSEDERIAKVSSDGTVTAVGIGTTTVTAVTGDGSFHARCEVTVTEKEHFTEVQEGSQQGGKDNMSAPQSAWMKTYGTLQKYSFKDPIDYAIRIEEMYIGKEAADLVEYENRANEDPSSSQQWIVIRFYMENRGGKTLRASELLSLDTFYTRTGASISPEWATFSKDRNGKGKYDVKLEAGASSDVWVGILLDKSVGFPYLKLSNTYDATEKEAKYLWLDTEPAAPVGEIPELTPPQAKTGLVYNKQAQELVVPGSVKGGVVMYATGDSRSAAGTYSAATPAGVDAGDYYVYYKIKWDDGSADTAEMGPVKVTVDKAKKPDNTPPSEMTVPAGTVRVRMVKLPEGWEWTDTYYDRALTPGEPLVAKAEYVAADKDNYRGGLSVDITITRELVRVTNVELNKKTATIKVGKTVQLTATVSPAEATNSEVTWSTSNKKIATVSQTGLVKGKKAGKAKIKVTTKDGEKTATCNITVKAVKVKSVSLNKTKKTLKKGKSYRLKATIKPSNATNKDVKWKSSNKKVATVSQSGRVKAKRQGKTTITVTTEDGKKKAKCKITVK